MSSNSFLNNIDLDNFNGMKQCDLPELPTKSIEKRIFVNREVNMSKIQYFGCMYFDSVKSLSVNCFIIVMKENNTLI